MGYVALALLSGLLLGVWKFGLSFYRGRISVYGIVLVSALAAGIAYVAVGWGSSSLAFDAQDMLEGLVGGACNLVGTLLLLEGYKRGKIAVVTGIAATYVLVPLTYSFIIGEAMTPVMAVGILVILSGMAIFYAGSVRERSGEATPVQVDAALFALGAGLFWGLAVVILDIGSLVSLTGTLAMSQIPQVAFTLVVVLLASRNAPVGINGRAIVVLAGSGLALAFGNMAYFSAANQGDIGVVSVLGGLSPVITVLLAVAFLHERLARREVVSLGIVLAGTLLVAV